MEGWPEWRKTLVMRLYGSFISWISRIRKSSGIIFDFELTVPIISNSFWFFSYHNLSTIIILTTVWLSLGPIFLPKKLKSKNLIFFQPVWLVLNGNSRNPVSLSFRKGTAFLLRMTRLKNFRIMSLLIYWDEHSVPFCDKYNFLTCPDVHPYHPTIYLQTVK